MASRRKSGGGEAGQEHRLERVCYAGLSGREVMQYATHIIFRLIFAKNVSTCIFV